MMRKACVFLLMLLSLSVVSVAAESPAFSLGTMQPTSKYRASPGETLTTEFYVFNAFGNRISHVTLAVGNNPANLDVQFIPALTTNTWNISGLLTPVQENLYMEPMPIVDEKPADAPADIYYLKAQNVSGFIPAKKIQALVKIPDDAPLGTTYDITVTALARWYGETGTAQVSQARPFAFSIRVLTANYSESLYEPEEQTNSGGFGLDNTMIFGIIIAVLVIVVLFQQFRPKRR